MAIQLGSAYGKVNLDVRGLRDGVKNGVSDLQKLQKAGALLSNTLQNAGRTLTIGLTLPILALGGASIKAASDFQETKNKAVVVFGEMADSVVANANKSATALGIGKQKYLDYASSIGAALTAGGMSIKQATELSEQAVKHFADLSSFHNAQVQDVGVAWESAIRGQFEPIQRYFPFITNQYLITYGTANGLIDANTKQLTANQRAIILNAIALDEKLNPALDDYAETSDGLANQARSAKEEFNDLLITLGDNLLPIVTMLVTELNKLLQKFNEMTPVQQKMLIGFLGFLAVLGPILSGVGKLIGIITTLSSLFGAGGTLAGMGTTFAGVGTAISTVAVPAVAGLGAALLPILVILAGMIFTVGLFGLAWKTNWLGIRDSITSGVALFKALWGAFTAWLRGDTDEATEYLAEAWNVFVERFNQIFEKIFGIKDAWSRFMNFMRNALRMAVTYIRDTFSNIDWSMIGRYILQGLANGLLLGLPNLLIVAKKISTDLLTQIKKSLGISSPSAEAMKLGMFTAQGFQMGLQRVSPDDMARSLVKPITNNSNSQQQTIIQNFSSGLTVSQARQMIEQNNDQLVNTMISALSG